MCVESLREAISLLVGFVALLAVAILGVLSFARFTERFNTHAKTLEGGMYVAGVLVLVHGVMMSVPLIRIQFLLGMTYTLLLSLIGLDVFRVQRFLRKRFSVSSV